MATHTKRRMRLGPGQADSMFLIERVSAPEGASQTFKAGAPLVWSSGALIEATAPPAAIAAFALEDAHNNAVAGAATVSVMPCRPGTEFYSNLLANAAANHTFAQADMGLTFQLQKAAYITGDATQYWHVARVTTGNVAAKPVSQVGDESPFADAGPAKVGDINARLLFVVKDSAAAWGT